MLQALIVFVFLACSLVACCLLLVACQRRNMMTRRSRKAEGVRFFSSLSSSLLSQHNSLKLAGFSRHSHAPHHFYSGIIDSSSSTPPTYQYSPATTSFFVFITCYSHFTSTKVIRIIPNNYSNLTETMRVSQNLSLLATALLSSSANAFAFTTSSNVMPSTTALGAQNSDRRAFFRNVAGVAFGSAAVIANGQEASASYSSFANREKDWQDRKESGGE